VAAARAAADALAVTPPTAPFGPAHARAAAFALMAEADEAERARAVSNARRQLEARDRAARLAGLIRATLPPTSHLLAAPAWVAMVGWINAEAARAEGTATAPAWAEVGKAWEDAGHRLDAAYAWYRHGHLVAATAKPRIASHDPFEWTRAVADHLGARALSERIPGADRLSGDASSPDLAGAPALQPDPIGDEVTRITVHALGRMRVERDGQPIRHLGGLKAGRRQAEAIFAFLLDRGAKGATKEEMVDLIWEEIDLAAADLAFHRTMGGLRRALQPAAPSRGRSAIRFDHDRYVLDPSIVTWTDVAAFNAAVDEAFASPDPFAKAMALEEARRLYRGDYFDDCPYFGDSADVEPTRTRLRGRYVDVLVMLGELAEERGDVRGAELLYREALDMAEDRAGAAADGLARVGAVRTELRVVSSR
jgi:DNA-binding SARP family transcriptional activator